MPVSLSFIQIFMGFGKRFSHIDINAKKATITRLSDIQMVFEKTPSKIEAKKKKKRQKLHRLLSTIVHCSTKILCNLTYIMILLFIQSNNQLEYIKFHCSLFLICTNYIMHLDLFIYFCLIRLSLWQIIIFLYSICYDSVGMKNESFAVILS